MPYLNCASGWGLLRWTLLRITVLYSALSYGSIATGLLLLLPHILRANRFQSLPITS